MDNHQQEKQSPQDNTVNQQSDITDSPPPARFPRRRVQFGLALTLIGFALFILGTRPELFGADRSPVIGFVQIATFMVGLGLISLGGYVNLMLFWKDKNISIAADIGVRMVSTGYVISVFAGMADIFGFGSHFIPDVPYFGWLQARGVIFGQIMIIIGFLLMLPKTEFSKYTNRLKKR